MGGLGEHEGLEERQGLAVPRVQHGCEVEGAD